MTQTALIVGAGSGLSAALARLFSKEGYAVALAARKTEKLSALAEETGARIYGCDATDADQVAGLFKEVTADLGPPTLVVYNPSLRIPGPLVDHDPGKVQKVLNVTAFGAFLVGQQAAISMLESGGGAILFTGASAGVKGYPRSAPFAMGKFALRGLCQSMARELAPQNIHVAHFIIDGLIRSEERGAPYNNPDTTLDPDEIARSYLQVARQDRSAWSWELELRPYTETF
ncbi:SDR family NAD(P)-dependent oxidoreductase [Rhodovibrionaceae bacterium A322]